MIGFKAACKFAVPIGVTFFCWLTMRTVASLPGESMVSYGFPVPWYAPNLASSMAYDVAIGPLVIDLIVYFAACEGMLSLLPGRSTMPKAAVLAVSVLLWLVAIGSAGALALVILSDPHFVAWTLDGYFGADAARSRSVRFGLGAAS